jgi:BirA family biotin operon repressor/biotin-[acetyl-CoA-carboxylase] ligase
MKMSFLWKVLQYYRMNSNISTKALFKEENQLFLPECQSTNDELSRLIREQSSPLEEGFLVRTDYQFSGRGQKGNTWNSEKGENLLFSFLLRPHFLAPRHSFWLSAAISVGLAKALENWLEGVKVKWPNDVLVGGQKIAGILIENTITGQVLDESIVGIGLNVNQLDLHFQATSLRKILNQKLELELVLKTVLDELAWAYFQLQIAGWEKMKSHYYQSLFKMGIPADFVLPEGQKFRGLIKGISEEGRLLIVSSKGEESFGFKEVALEY